MKKLVLPGVTGVGHRKAPEAEGVQQFSKIRNKQRKEEKRDCVGKLEPGPQGQRKGREAAAIVGFHRRTAGCCPLTPGKG